jgi:hypothetical protein
MAPVKPEPLLFARAEGQCDGFLRLKPLRVTPAMQAGLTDHVWTIEELCNLLPESKAAKSTIEHDMLVTALKAVEK